MKPTNPTLIAPCGINCRLCRAYTRERKACPGCREENAFKSNACTLCKIKICEKAVTGKFEYCFECSDFPCARVKHLDKRYRTKYATSPIGNLLRIKEFGIEDFIEDEDRKWTCPECGTMLCMHKPQCLSCGYVWHELPVSR